MLSTLDLVAIDGPAVLAVHGELDGQTGTKFRACIHALVAEGHRRVVLDLRGLTFIDSQGIGALVWAVKRLRRGGGDLVLRSLTPHTMKILEISGLNRVLTVEG